MRRTDETESGEERRGRKSAGHGIRALEHDASLMPLDRWLVRRPETSSCAEGPQSIGVSSGAQESPLAASGVSGNGRDGLVTAAASKAVIASKGSGAGRERPACSATTGGPSAALLGRAALRAVRAWDSPASGLT